MTSLTELIFAARDKAEQVRRRSDGALYGALAACLVAAERCLISDLDKEELRGLIAQRPLTGGKNRTFAEKGSDEFQIVCRLVFIEGQSHSNINRYAIAIRQAHQRGIAGSELVQWLGANGGINELYLSRPLDADQVYTKCLRLSSGIVVKKGEPFTITLTRLPNNSYKVG